MTDQCPDCGRDKSPIDRCSPDSLDDDGECPYLTIARLRSELDSALARVELEQATMNAAVEQNASDEVTIIGLRRELADTRQALDHANEELAALREYLGPENASAEAKRRSLPDRLYVERWPETADRDDAIHYEPTGYGNDLRGNTSTITVYRKMTRAELRAEKKAKRR